MQQIQQVTINVLDMPTTPDTGDKAETVTNGLANAMIANPVIVVTVVLAVILLVLGLVFLCRKHKSAACIMFSLVAVPAIALPMTIIHTVQAASSLVVDNSTVDITIYKSATQPITESIASATTVATDNATGYTVS